MDYSPTEQEFDPRMVMTEYDFAACYEAQVQFDNNSSGAHHDPSEYVEDDGIMSEAMQRSIWDAAVEESVSLGHNYVPYEGPSTYAKNYNDYQAQACDAQSQQQEEQDYQYEDEESQQEEQIQPKSKLMAYVYHRFGPHIRYEDRCSCHEHLYDAEEEQKKYEREYYAQAGQTHLMKDRCVLLPHPQAALPGTEHVDKPALTVTTPEGETWFPHDVEEYPDPPPASWHGPGIGWGGAPPPRGLYLVPYEDEDGADI
ncbi:hypothetical protein UCDDA912_g05601 [Diaporthe ampelina]|uniref:Uncharacterized protein n=1 Tax=Diaporthe ampelina TaxID=1214573 RepID=A0A0G2I360_9PEZI|nr:hypothetical protein UCDDA912_g05601 [Diaporthe ampelina]